MNDWEKFIAQGEFDLDALLEEYRRLRNEWRRLTVELDAPSLFPSSPPPQVNHPSWGGKISPLSPVSASEDLPWKSYLSGR